MQLPTRPSLGLRAYQFRTWMLRGRQPQAFVGARWVAWLVRACPGRWKRGLALRLLALSPHYFFRHARPEYRAMSTGAIIAAEYERNRVSRRKIYAHILKPLLAPGLRVLDYGCGPGFLAWEVARDAEQVFAADISEGVLACAAALNRRPNLRYLRADERGLSTIPEGSLDAVYSFALVQHVTDATLRQILALCFRKLKPGARLILHVNLGEQWRSEGEWKSDRSPVGRILYTAALHCFSRERAAVERSAREAGFEIISFTTLRERCPEPFDDICQEVLLVARKPRANRS